jgi:hypothetical protein
VSQAKDKAVVRRRINQAFDKVISPTRIEGMRFLRYTGDDSYEMAAAFVGKRWMELPLETLFYHRESLGTLAPEAYRAYLPAYLDAVLAADDASDRHGADLRFYLLATLKHWSHQRDDERGVETRARLGALDPAQRTAVGAVLRYLHSHWRSDDVSELIREWT